MLRHLFAGTIVVSFCGVALGSNDQEPGSLLLFPEFDSTPGHLTILTVTNTQMTGSDIDIHYIYVGAEDCELLNLYETLTPADTLSVLTHAHNPDSDQGFAYVYALDRDTGQRIDHDYLVGSTKILDGFRSSEYSIRPYSFEFADVDDGDDLCDLDGLEYEMAPGELLFPHFIGVSPGRFDAELILLNISGGAAFEARTDLLVFNDNEQMFSGSYNFTCWEKISLGQLSPAFLQSFLKSTNHDPMEVRGATMLETGWFRIDGDVAWSSTTSIQDPVILGALVEHGRYGSTAELPFTIGAQDNGKLLSTAPDGN